ncbi:MAG TPA: hypothetical protein VFK37_04565 [Bacillales bacterium]|nr:hypothetical protein [Bacillales bacterium]
MKWIRIIFLLYILAQAPNTFMSGTFQEQLTYVLILSLYLVFIFRKPLFQKVKYLFYKGT